MCFSLHCVDSLISLAAADPSLAVGSGVALHIVIEYVRRYVVTCRYIFHPYALVCVAYQREPLFSFILLSALCCSSKLSLGALSAAGRGGLVTPGREGLAAPGRGDLAAPGRGGLAAPGRGSLAAPGRGSLAAPGRGGLAAPGRGGGGLAAPGRGGLAAPGRGGLAAPGRGGLAAPGRGGLAAPGRGGLGCSRKGGLGCSRKGGLGRSRKGGLGRSRKGGLGRSRKGGGLGRSRKVGGGGGWACWLQAETLMLKYIECKAIHTQLTILLFLPCMSKVDCLLFFIGMTTFGQKLTSHGLFRSRGTKGNKSCICVSTNV